MTRPTDRVRGASAVVVPRRHGPPSRRPPPRRSAVARAWLGPAFRSLRGAPVRRAADDGPPRLRADQRTGRARRVWRGSGPRADRAQPAARPRDLGRSAACRQERAAIRSPRRSSPRVRPTSPSTIASATTSIARREGGRHQGVVAWLGPFTYADLDELILPDEPAMLVALDSVEDPRNLGAVLRSAYSARRARRDHSGASRRAGHAARREGLRRCVGAAADRARAEPRARARRAPRDGRVADRGARRTERAADRSDRRHDGRTCSCSAPKAAAYARSSRSTATSTR